MPTAAPHSCSAPGCPAAVPPGQARCQAHTQHEEQQRLSRSLRGYDRAWYRFVAAYRLGAGLDTTHPDYHLHLDARNRCAVCGARRGLDFDHIIPIASGGPRLDPSNVQPLCHRHHAAKTMREMHSAGVQVLHQPETMNRKSLVF